MDPLIRRKEISHPRLPEILDSLCVRFIVNCPQEELQSFERVCFQIEQAHWYYDDNYRDKDPTLPEFTLKQFAEQLFSHCPMLQPYIHQLDHIMKRFADYKYRVPVYGAIILNPKLDKCLLVKSFNSGAWSFPKGKVNKDELGIDCAIREVFEETGYEISRSQIREEDHISVTSGLHPIKLYIVPFVPEDTPFKPRTRKEIAEVRWVDVDSLPSSQQEYKEGKKKFFVQQQQPPPPPLNGDFRPDEEKNDSDENSAASSSIYALGEKYKSFFNVVPFVKKLKEWIANRKKQLHMTTTTTTTYRYNHYNNNNNNNNTYNYNFNNHHHHWRNQYQNYRDHYFYDRNDNYNFSSYRGQFSRQKSPYKYGYSNYTSPYYYNYNYGYGSQRFPYSYPRRSNRLHSNQNISYDNYKTKKYVRFSEDEGEYLNEDENEQENESNEPTVPITQMIPEFDEEDQQRAFPVDNEPFVLEETSQTVSQQQQQQQQQPSNTITPSNAFINEPQHLVQSNMIDQNSNARKASAFLNFKFDMAAIIKSLEDSLTKHSSHLK